MGKLGNVMRHEFMEPMKLSIIDISIGTGLCPYYIVGILELDKEVSRSAAEELGLFFGTSAEFWINLNKKAKVSDKNAEQYNISSTGLQDRKEVTVEGLVLLAMLPEENLDQALLFMLGMAAIAFIFLKNKEDKNV